MKIDNLQNVFNNFLYNSDRAILIDGPWGVGKTYQILQFLKQGNGKDTKISYVSLFGKASIDEIHTIIYKGLHPAKAFGKTLGKEFLGVVPKVVGLANDKVGSIIPNLEYILKTDRESKVGCKNKKQIIILDDFERLDFNQISFNEILGYFNDLLLQQVKIIVVCNVKEISNNNFLSFKEKVFDREYRISATNKEIIKNYFGTRKDLLDDIIISEFQDNLRIANRVSDFFRQVTDILRKYNENYSSIYTDKTILIYCTFVVVGANTNIYEKYKIEKDRENINGDNGLDYSAFIISDLHILDEQISDLVKHIIFYAKNNDKFNSYIGEEFVLGLVELYYYNDSSKLLPFFSDKQDMDRNPLLKNVFYLSDDDKRNVLNEQLEYIIAGKNLGNTRLYETVRDFCKYYIWSDFSKKEESLINYFIQNKDIIGTEIYPLVAFSSDKDDTFSIFAKKLHEKYQDSLLKDFIVKLKKNIVNDNYVELYNDLYDMQAQRHCLVFDAFGRGTLKKEIIEILKTNNYLIDNLYGSIEYNQWNVALSVVELSIKFGFSGDVKSFIEKLDKGNDKSAKERYDILLEKLK